MAAPRILSFGGGAPDVMSSIGRHVSKLTGYAPALPTPFGAEGDIDIPAFERLCDLQLAHGATALIVCGTTGEEPPHLTQKNIDCSSKLPLHRLAGEFLSLPGPARTQRRMRSN